jgi:D-alanyl-D-alanine carboxypeptidase
MTVERLPAHDQVPISALAEGMPARKINVKGGQVWDRDDLLRSMLLVSANDAAVALAERIGGGSLDTWVDLAQATADRLGLEDRPVLNDPSGLDDEFSHDGGSLISARDLAIVARAVLARPDLMAVAGTPQYLFHGGDGLDHELNNHDTFLRLYEGATGLKTGFTENAGRTLVATAQRNGRTMLVVEFDAVDIYASATQLLDQGFATPLYAERNLPRLPDVVPDASVDVEVATEDTAAAPATDGQALAAPGAAPPAASGAATVAAGASAAGGDGDAAWNSAPVAAALLVLGTAPLLVVLRRRAMRRHLEVSPTER